MVRIYVRRSNDVSYFTNDDAREIDGLRSGGPGWWLRGSGDPAEAREVSDVLQTTERSTVHGYDIVIAAPRPVSVLLGVDAVSAPGVVEAHRQSVHAAMDYLEDHALVVRDRRLGVDRDESGRWRSIISYTHGINRHGEPHLHDHVLVGARPDAARTVLDSRALFAHTQAADALYRASLRHELAERTPWSSWRSFEGVEHVVGLDEGYRALWSGHHQQRGEKLRWGRAETVASWAKDLGRFESQGVMAEPHERRSLDEHAFAGAFEGRHDVARRHVVAAWANAARFGQDPRSIARAIDALYPDLNGSRGVHEPPISVRDARMVPLVREHGPRPLDERLFDEWRQRSRAPRSRSERSR